MLSISSLQDLWSCEKKFDFSQVQRISPRSAPVPMKLGSWLHLLLAAHYSGKSWPEAHQMLADKFALLDEGMRERYGDLPGRAARLMESYLYHWEVLWRDQGSEDFETVAVEKVFETDYFSCTIDLLAKDRNGLYFLMEHKTGKEFPYNHDMMMLEPQISLQIEAVRAHGYDVRYAIYNYLRSQEPSIPVFNKDGSIRKSFGKMPSTDYLTLYNTIREQERDPADYQEALDELAKPSQNKYFKRVQVGRNIALARQAASWLVNSVPRAMELSTGAREPIRMVSFRCNMCVYQPLCAAEILGQNADYVRQTQYESRSDERVWLKGDDDA